MLDILFSNPFIVFVLGSVLLFYSSDLLVENSIVVSNKFNIPRFIIGGTIIALGTSLPEIIVSVLANIKGNSGVSIGNIIGSNIANIGLVLGVSLFFKNIIINKNNYEYLFNTFWLILITVVFYVIILNGSLLFVHGCFFILMYCLYFFIHIKCFKSDNSIDEYSGKMTYAIIKLIIGFLLIYYGSQLFIDGAIGIADIIGVNDVAVGLTIVALGTSAPELLVSINAIKKDESMIAIGNLFGSNIANIVFAGGISCIIKSININTDQIFIYSSIMLFLTLFLSLIIIFSKKIYKIYSLIFTSVYIIFIYMNFNN